ncbi:hypothetical protein Hanom_Chr00s154795g01823231 [Helianthus anomalus]
MDCKVMIMLDEKRKKKAFRGIGKKCSVELYGSNTMIDEIIFACPFLYSTIEYIQMIGGLIAYNFGKPINFKDLLH